MTDVAHLGGGYAASAPDPGPTVTALLASRPPRQPIFPPRGLGRAARRWQNSRRPSSSRAQPQHLSSSTKTKRPRVLSSKRPHCGATRPTRLTARRTTGKNLRPLEYASALSAACTNLVGTRQALLVGGFGPELGVDSLWEGLAASIAPATLCVLHLDPPPLDIWRARMAGRGSRADASYFTHLAQALGNLPVWAGAVRIPTDGPLEAVVQRALDALG